MGCGARTTASINRFSIRRGRALELRQATTRGPPLGRLLRSDVSAARLSNNAAIAGMLDGRSHDRAVGRSTRYVGITFDHRLTSGITAVTLVTPVILRSTDRRTGRPTDRLAGPSHPHRHQSTHHLTSPL